MGDVDDLQDGTSRTMRVLMLSTSYPRDLTDWRGLFIRHLADALTRSPLLRLSLWNPPGDFAPGATPIMLPEEAEWLGQLMAAGGIAHLMRTGGIKTAFAPLKLLKLLAGVYRRHRDVDAYHINWLQCALPLPANGKPALITVLGNDMKLLRVPLMKSLLRRVMRNRRVVICPNADWMQAPLQAAFGDVAEIRPVAFGIDPSWYAVQRTPSIAPRRWLAVTRLTRDKLGPLFEWSEPLFRDSGRELHLFGPMQETVAVPDWVHYHGAATPEQLANDWFPHAQGLITLSRHAEGRPQVMLEAMAAGLPIIASRMPAHDSMVVDGTTGSLCSSSDDYAKAVAALEDAPTNRRCGEAARAWAEREVGTWDDCANRYATIYRQLLSGSARHA